MRLFVKLMIGFLIIALFVVFIGAFNINSSLKIRENIDKIVLSNILEVESSSNIAYHIQRSKSNIREILLEAEDGKPEELDYAKGVVRSSISEIEKSILIWEDAIKIGVESEERGGGGGVVELTEEEELDEFNDLKDKLNEYTESIKEFLSIYENKGLEEADEFFEDNTEPLSREIQDEVRELEDESELETIEESENVQKRINDMLNIVRILTIISIIVAGILSFFITKSITGPLKKLIDGSYKIGKGNFNTRIKINTKDELNDLANTFNQMAVDLKSSTISLKDMEKKVKEKTKEIQSKLDELEKFNKITVGRELEMIKLKKMIKELRSKLQNK